MVVLRQLEARGFKNLKLERPLVFPEGVTLVEGLNEAGKSSILDAILYALYAKVIRPHSFRTEDIISYGAGEAMVSLDFSVGDTTYRVVRVVQRTGVSKATLYVVGPDGGPAKTLASRQRSVSEKIVEILGGITYGEMVSTTVVAQKDLGKLLEMGREDRAKTVNIFLNLEGFNRVSERLEEERREILGSPRRRGLLDMEMEALRSVESEYREYLEREAGRERLEAEINSLSRHRDEMEREVARATELHRLLQRYDELAEKRSGLEEKARLMREKAALLKPQILSLKGELARVDGEMEALRVLAGTGEILKRFQDGLDEAGRLATRLEEVKSLRDRLEEESTVLERILIQNLGAGRRTYLKAFGAGLASFMAAMAAFLLSQPLTGFALALLGGLLILLGVRRVAAAMRAVRLEDRVNEKRRQASELALQAQNMEMELRDKLSEMARMVGGHPQVVGAELGLEGLRRMLDQWRMGLERWENLVQIRAGLVERLAQLPPEEELAELEREADKLEDECAGVVMPKLPEGVVFSRELLRETAGHREELVKELTRIEEALRRSVAELDDLRRWLDEHGNVVERLESRRARVEELERRLTVLNISLETLRNTAESIRAKVRPAVEQYLTHIIPTFTEGRYRAALLDDDFNLHVWDPDAGQYRVRDVFSGGTEDQLLLSLRLAFALALIPEVKGVKPEFLFLDEPLSSSDERRRVAIMEYVRGALTRRFRQIFIISHVPGLEEFADSVIRLEDGRVV